MDDIISQLSSKVYRFIPANKFHCPACGQKPFPRWVEYIRLMLGNSALFSTDFSYCVGSKPPSEDRKVSLFGGLATGEVEIKNHCLGIDRPHLHVICLNCKYTFFMEVEKP